MKILILANDDEGLYQFRRELIVELVKKNELYASVPEGPYKNDLISIGCKLEFADFNRHGTNPIRDFVLFCNYIKLIRKIKPDVVLTYTIKPNVYGGMACRLCKTPYLPNITGLGTAVENGGFMQKLTLLLYKIALKKANCIFFQNSENERFMLDKGVIRGKHELIPGSGVNLNYFQKKEYPNDDKIVFSFISRIMKEKGIEQFLGAAESIKAKYPNTEFHICGYCEQDYESKLIELDEKGIIIYHGCIRDVREMHAISHCTIHPTYYPEGLSNVLIESLSCCRPIITTDRSGCREVIDDGINGFLVKQKDTNDLIRVVEKFLNCSNDQRKAMGLAGRKKVEELFDRSIVVSKYIEAIDMIGK